MAPVLMNYQPSPEAARSTEACIISLQNPRIMSTFESIYTSTSGARRYGSYQLEIYGKGMFHNIRPTVTTDPNKLEEQAEQVMNVNSFNYVAGGAGERATMDANRLAFRQWKVHRTYTSILICRHISSRFGVSS